MSDNPTETTPAISDREAMDSIVATVLTPAQQEAIDFYRALNVPGSWFIGQQGDDGRVEVICLGEGFVWSFIVSADGRDVSSQEASLGEFSTGIDV